jgi:hypothetical protein
MRVMRVHRIEWNESDKKWDTKGSADTGLGIFDTFKDFLSFIIRNDLVQGLPDADVRAASVFTAPAEGATVWEAVGRVASFAKVPTLIRLHGVVDEGGTQDLIYVVNP